MWQASRVIGEKGSFAFRAGFDKVEINFKVHVGAIAIFDFICDEAVISHKVRVPKAGGPLTFFIKNLPRLVVIEAELTDSVVLVLQGHMPLADDLRGVAVLLELPNETRLRWMQVDVLLTLAVQHDFQPILKRVSAG